MVPSCSRRGEGASSHTLALMRNKEDKAGRDEVAGGRLWSLRSSLSYGDRLRWRCEGSSHKREQAPEATLLRRLLDAEESRWLIFNEACILQSLSSLASVTLSYLELS